MADADIVVQPYISLEVSVEWFLSFVAARVWVMGLWMCFKRAEQYNEDHVVSCGVERITETGWQELCVKYET